VVTRLRERDVPHRVAHLQEIRARVVGRGFPRGDHVRAEGIIEPFRDLVRERGDVGAPVRRRVRRVPRSPGPRPDPGPRLIHPGGVLAENGGVCPELRLEVDIVGQEEASSVRDEKRTW